MTDLTQAACDYNLGKAKYYHRGRWSRKSSQWDDVINTTYAARVFRLWQSGTFNPNGSDFRAKREHQTQTIGKYQSDTAGKQEDNAGHRVTRVMNENP